MGEYVSPGVYMEEISLRNQPIEGVSTSTAGFIGFAERGRTTPQLVTGFEQYQRMYGGFTENSYLAYAVDGFFRNGGQRCYVARIPNSEERLEKELNGVTFKAVGKGSWGNRIFIFFEKNKQKPDNFFTLKIVYWPVTSKVNLDWPFEMFEKSISNSGRIEVHENITNNKLSEDYIVRRINGISHLIEVEPSDIPLELPWAKAKLLLGEVADSNQDEINPSVIALFNGGSENVPPEERTGLQAFKEIEQISIVAIPDLHKIESVQLRENLAGNLINHCETDMKYRFAIIDASKGQHDITEMTKSFNDSFRSKYAAFYYPWIKVQDPLTKSLKLIPPSGHVAGIYARSDHERGVHKAPANEVVRGAAELEYTITKGEQGILNPLGINVIRSFPGRGILVWGARTTILFDPLWKYINVRRLFIYLQHSIERGSQWAVFEPNDEKLWARIRGSISEFLTRQWRDGALMGTRVEEAFFVKCDRTTMTQDDIDNGRLIAIIGVAPVKPAEFVIFRIGQVASALDVTEVQS